MPMNRLMLGALAGATATSAMTMAMAALHRRLPRQDHYALPPREITESIAQKTGAARLFTERGLRDASLASHFLYGAATGALYGLATREGQRLPASVGAGAAYGLLVWALSYLGWIPASGVLRPATEHPARRTAVMLAAHVVWGGVVGLTTAQLDRAERIVARPHPAALVPDRDRALPASSDAEPAA